MFTHKQRRSVHLARPPHKAPSNSTLRRFGLKKRPRTKTSIWAGAPEPTNRRHRVKPETFRGFTPL